MELKGHRIRLADVNRPALQLSGYFEHFEQSRVQIIGMVEYTYLQHLNDSEKDSIYSRFLKYDIPCVIFCRDLQPDDLFLQRAKENNDSGIRNRQKHIRIHGGADLSFK